MLTKSKFNVGDTVYITLEASNNHLLMEESLPMNFFQLGFPYIIKQIKNINLIDYVECIDYIQWEIKIKGSNQYFNEDYFSKDNKYKSSINIENIMNQNITNEDNNSETFINECEQKAKQFTDESLKLVNSLLSNDYKLGFKEGVEKYLIQNYNTNDVINNMRKFSQEELNQKY